MCNGGGPYNILKDLVKLAADLPREAIGLVGEDLNGQWIAEDCQAAGIDITQLQRTDQASTSYTDAMTVVSTGRRTFFHQRGANALLAPENFDFQQTKCKIFVLGYLMLLDTLDAIDAEGTTGAAKVLAAARAAGLITAVDCVSEPSSNFREVVLSAMANADILFLNEFEIGQVLGYEVAAERAPMAEAALALAAASPNQSLQIVLHAAGGAVVVKSDGTIVIQGSVQVPADRIAGASGAGDAFAAGYLIGVHDDQPVAECLRNAVCAAAMSLTDATPSGGMQSLESCLAMGEALGFRDF